MFLVTPKSTCRFFVCCGINNVVIWVRESGGIMYHFQNSPFLVFTANSLQLALSIYQKFQLNANNCFIFWHVRVSSLYRTQIFIYTQRTKALNAFVFRNADWKDRLKGLWSLDFNKFFSVYNKSELFARANFVAFCWFQ